MNPHEWHFKSEAAERAGRHQEARRILEHGLAAHPGNAELANSAGSLALRQGDAGKAEAYFASAAGMAPERLDFALNRAIALGRMGQSTRAVQVLEKAERLGVKSAKYWSARANAERTCGKAGAAAQSYDRCLAIDPAHIRGLHGRARVALERAEHDASARFDRALARNSGDANLWLGKAQALDVDGDHKGARGIIEQVVEQAPGWIEGLKFLAQLRLAEGDTDFADHFARAAKRLPQDPNIPTEHARLMASVDRPAEAAKIIASARGRFDSEPRFALYEAAYAGTAGDLDRAEEIFADLSLRSIDRLLHECRHWLRRHDYQRAEALAGEAIALDPNDVSAWALRGLAWRLLDDERAAWLHEQEGLVRLIALEAEDELLGRAREALDELHDRSPFPLGQSLRGGTQTRHSLFMRHEPVFAELHRAILATLETFRQGLPRYDATHPLLRYRNTQWRLAGSWSVRLAGGGDHHASHIHPQGVLSSAVYMIVPEPPSENSGAGCLEIGRPPPDLQLDLGPLATIRPEPGKLALFPSTLYHGTTPFTQAKRMTVAFDVIPEPEASADG